MNEPAEVKPQTTVVETTRSEVVSKGAKPANAESTAFGISIRGWIAAIIVVTMCVMSYLGKDVAEPLRSAVLFALGHYFGQKTTVK